MITQETNGVFLGRVLGAKASKQGGVRNVFAQIQGLKNDLVFFPFGSKLYNPFPGQAKIYAGDLLDFQLDDKAQNPKMYVLKTYEVYGGTGTTLNLVRDGYHHIPFVGDKLGIAPDEIGGTVEALEVTGVSKATVDGQKVWTLTLKTAPTTAAKKGDVLVEAKDGKMLIKRINAVAPCDYDFCYAPVADPTSDSAYDDAVYMFTPVIGGIMYTHRMSVMPQCVLDLNESKIDGIFKINAL